MALAVPLPAQAPRTEPEPARPDPRPQQDPGKQEPGKQEPGKQEPPPPPPDDAARAAEALRKALGLEPGGQVPPAEPRAGEPAVPQEPGREPSAQEPGKQDPPPGQQPGQQPEPPAPPAKPPDETEQGARGIELLLPGAERRTDPQERPVSPDPAAGGTPAAVPTAPPAADGAPAAVRGSLQLHYRLRRTGEDGDQELLSLLTLDAGDALRDPVTAHFLGRAFLDIDGLQGTNAFNGLDETTGDAVGGYVYEAYADFHRIPSLEVARLGRQSLFTTPELVEFDGAYAETERFGDLHGFGAVYGGIPVHHYEASRSGDAVFGLAGGLEPWTGGRLRFDWMHIADETRTFDGRDDLLGLSWWQGLGDWLLLEGKHTWLDGDPRDLLLRGHGAWPALQMDATVVYRELLRAQSAQVTEFDPFFPVLATYEPYRQLELTLNRSFGDDLTVSAGADVRRLRDAADEGQFNHEYERVWLGPSLSSLFGADLELSLFGEYWDADGDDRNSVIGDLRWRPAPEWLLVLGSSYALYRFDTLDDIERDHVRDYYLRVQHRPSAAWRLDGALEFEDNDFDRFFLLRMGVTWTF